MSNEVNNQNIHMSLASKEDRKMYAQLLREFVLLGLTFDCRIDGTDATINLTGGA